SYLAFTFQGSYQKVSDSPLTPNSRSFFFLSLQVGIVFLANSVRIRKPARSRSPLRFRQAPKAQQKPQLAKTAGSFPVFSFSEFDQLLPRLLP
ncbi:hypothetical protein, partial [Eggerthella lenta]|uniref:hypothetical protein n=1 Tax=Eggerthella lenta TaxID=84112 RepID=UPI0032C091DE